ncbi:OmpA family protein [uncultured Muriicola sp.]|uniref:OmpA family protein n=1 Tax=uncultured Muriicola sp. TaxID=1583102 RepID=UPI0026178B02|nr:OmpA family protein [uncultured Muriicola sp.]
MNKDRFYMKIKRNISLLLVICMTGIGSAQKKKDLILKVAELETDLQTTKSDLSSSKQEAARYKGEMEAVNIQLDELKATNASLLENLTNFTELSNKKTDNIGKSLETLRTKEKQLKMINDALTRTDSVTLDLLTSFKNVLGTDAKTGLNNGAVTIILENTFLFNEVDKNFAVVERALPVLEKIARVLKQQPNLKILVETNSNALEFKELKLTDNWDLSALQAASVVRVLTNTYAISPERMQAIGKSEFGFDGIETTTKIRVQPPYDSFYKTIKEMMK